MPKLRDLNQTASTKPGAVQVDAGARIELTQRLFGSGKSIGWLTAVFRAEIFAHGIYGNDEKPEVERLFSRAELDNAGAELLRRYREMTPADLDHLPRFSPLLYSWSQYAPESLTEIREKVVELCQSDEDFLKLLQKMRSWRATNGAVSYPLKESGVSSFMDIWQATSRLKSLVDHTDSAIALQAKELLGALISVDEE